MGPPKAPRNAGKLPASKSDQTIRFADEAESVQVHDYPTVLVAGTDDGLDDLVVNCSRRNGFHVLEADSWEHVFDVVRVHSRPIHLLLADVSMDARMPILKMHRSELQVLFVEKPVNADDVLAKVRQLLGSPPSSPSIC